MDSVTNGQYELNSRGILLLVFPLLLLGGAIFFLRDYGLQGLFFYPLYPLTLGAGFYLVYAGGYARVAGLAGLLLLAVIFSLPRVIFPVFISNDWGQANWGALLPALKLTLIAPAAVAVVAFIAPSTNYGGRTFTMFSLWAALAVLFISIYVNGPGMALFHNIDPFKAGILVRSVITASSLMLFALLAQDFCQTGGYLFKPSVWGRLWCGLIFVSTLSVMIYYFFKKDPAALFSILSLPAAIGMFLMIFGIRGGFHLTIIGISFAVITKFAALPEAGRQWPTVVGGIIGALLNFSITWALLRKALARSWSRADHPQKPMPLIVPTLEILPAGLSVLLIISIIDELASGRHKTPAIIGLTAAIALLLLNGVAITRGFRRKDSYVLHAVCLMIMAAIIIFVVTGIIIHS